MEGGLATGLATNSGGGGLFRWGRGGRGDTAVRACTVVRASVGVVAT